VIGFYGEGIPVDLGAASDTLSYPAPAAPLLNSTVTLGDAGFPIYPQARTYSFAATVVGTSVSVGNTLVQRAYATDSATAPGTLAPVFVVLPNAKLPAGVLQGFQYWNQGIAGGSPTTSAGNVFHDYVLRPTGVPNGYTVIYDSGLQTVPVPTVPAGEVATVAVSPSVAVNAGDVIGFYGEGIPVDLGAASDTLSYPAPAAPALNSTMTLGADAGFPIYPQARTYSFAGTVTPSG